MACQNKLSIFVSIQLKPRYVNKYILGMPLVWHTEKGDMLFLFNLENSNAIERRRTNNDNLIGLDLNIY